MNRNAHFFQHVPFENLAEIRTWLSVKGFDITSSGFHESWPVPDLKKTDLLIIMGGPMGIYDYDEHSWLYAEKRFIKRAINSGINVLGICLGAQLIADVLGEKIIKNPEKEIGWFPVEKVSKNAVTSGLPDTFNAFHWHGDTFGLPEGAVHLFKSKACKNQGFIYDNRVLALQFHLESNAESVGKLVKNCGDELVNAPFIHGSDRITSDTEKYFMDSNKLLFSLLDSFLDK